MSSSPLPRRSERIATAASSARESSTPEATIPADGTHSPLPCGEVEPTSETTRGRQTSSFGKKAKSLKEKISTPVLRGAKALAQAAKSNFGSSPKPGTGESSAGGPAPAELQARLEAINAEGNSFRADPLGPVPHCFPQSSSVGSFLGGATTRDNTPTTAPSSSIVTPPVDDGRTDASSDNNKVVRAKLPNRPSVRGLFEQFSEENKEDLSDVPKDIHLRGGGVVPFPGSGNPVSSTGVSGHTTPPSAPVVRLIPPTPLAGTDKTDQEGPDKTFLRPPFRRSPRGSLPASDDDISVSANVTSALPVRPAKDPRRFWGGTPPTPLVSPITTAETSSTAAAITSTSLVEGASASSDPATEDAAPAVDAKHSQSSTMPSTTRRKRKSDVADVESETTKTASKKAKRRGGDFKQPNHRTAAIPKSALKAGAAPRQSEASGKVDAPATEKIILRIPQRTPSRVPTPRPASLDKTVRSRDAVPADVSSELAPADASPDIEPSSSPSLAGNRNTNTNADDTMDVDGNDESLGSKALTSVDGMEALYMLADVAANAPRAEVPKMTVAAPVVRQEEIGAPRANASDIARHTAAEDLLRRMRGVLDAAAQSPAQVPATPVVPRIAQADNTTEVQDPVTPPQALGLRTSYSPVATEPGWVPTFWYTPPRSRIPTSSIRSTAIEGDEDDEDEECL